jgi:hypothetical protein
VDPLTRSSVIFARKMASPETMPTYRNRFYNFSSDRVDLKSDQDGLVPINRLDSRSVA